MEAVPFVNKVAESGIITIDLEQFLPPVSSLAYFDIKPFLFMELILKEKDFREQLKSFDWSVYFHKHVGIFCSADAILPVWAYMLITTYLQPVVFSVRNANADTLEELLLAEKLFSLDVEEYRGQRVVIKGCGERAISSSAYTAITARLLPVVKSVMYGEPCSTVPVYKKKS